MVDLLDVAGLPIRGYRARLSRVDNIRQRVPFEGPLSKLEGKTVRLRVQLRNASLYAFQIRK